MAYTSIPDMVRSTARRFGPATAFSHRGVRLTFTQVDELSDHFAAYLQKELGLVEGDRIVLQMPNLLQYPVALFGAQKAGLIVVNANPLYTPVELAKVVADARPRALVVLANFAGKVAEILPGSGIEHVIVTEAGDLFGSWKRVLVNTMVAKVRKLVPPYVIPGAVGLRTALARGPVEGAQVDFDTASRVESRYFTELVTGQQAKNMIQAFFFDLGSINSGALRPDGVEKKTAVKVGVLGAGMMGAGIAYSCARAGMQVVLKDVTVENAAMGKAYTADLNDRAVSRGKLTQKQAAELLDRITATADPADLADCDLVIEAVFEDVSLKQRVFAEILPHVKPDALLCTNTSTLPITDLAKGIDRPADFIGLHFFSPVDKMPLIEIIRGAETSDATLAGAYDVALQLGKTPIVVNDSRGFYTSRVIGTRIEEGLALLHEGMAPYSLERAATQAGYPVGPLQLADELNFELMHKIAKTTREAAGEDTPTVTESVVGPMIDRGRSGKLKGAGFYDYTAGRRGQIWPGLADLIPVAGKQIPLKDAQERLLVREALETAKCFEEGVLTSAAHANIGSILGLGFPPATGGAAQFITGYEAPDGSIGLAAFIRRADELADRYGEQLRPTQCLRDMAAAGETFPA
ncbi:3-hydroxyacyl-CoA dehydrogenase NAD-binding domain-containing protein [Streptomyces sp. NPDC007808]|uniref:3-hydroxyacyl-CoA dehydrogenase NAD-binding domain-containing protein n=1 Tax=Streptomyces sp. NPDC007808 TaxID=3364779 RepID=UPI0036C61E69